MSCWFSIASWRAMRAWWCETETLDPGLEQTLRSAKPIFCYGRKHIIQAFRLLRFSKVASKILLIFAASETAGINRGSLSETTQEGWPASWNASRRYLWQPPWPRRLSFSSTSCQLPLFWHLVWSKFCFLPGGTYSQNWGRVFGIKFLLGLCLMLLGSNAVCPSAP